MLKKLGFRFAILLTITLAATIFFFSAAAAVDSSSPVISNIAPVEGLSINSPTAIIKFNVNDPDNISDALSDYYIKVNGKTVSANFMFDGKWMEGYGGSYYQVSTRTAAYISGTATGLKDGPQTVEVMVKDRLGNSALKTWSFNTAVTPQFSAMTPGSNSITNNNTSISVTISDNVTVDPGSIIMTLDGLPVQHIFDPISGTVSYTAQVPLLKGFHTVGIFAADMAGNRAVSSWSYTVGSALRLAYSDSGVTYTNASPNLSVSVDADSKINSSSVIMKIDGNQVPASFTYKGHWAPGSYSADYVIDNYNQGTIVYSASNLKDGVHSLEVSVRDVLGNSAVNRFNFYVAQKPVIQGYSPTGNITSNTPVITAKVVDPNSPIDQSQVKLLFNNRQVVPEMTGSEGSLSISYAPGKLADDSNHTVSLTVSDISGNSATTSWNFHVGTKQDMGVTPQDCGTCHQLSSYSKYKHSIPPDAGLAGSGGTCGHCHKAAIVEQAVCEYCHDGDPWKIHFGTAVPDPQIGANTDCMACHGIGSRDFIQRKLFMTAPAPQVTTWYKIAHDVPNLHLASKGSCSECHSTYLTREHNRVTDNGVQMTCATCHKSADPAVRNAIAAKNTECYACHSTSGHDSSHISNIDINCQSCHKGTISQEHINNFTTAGKNLTCDSCHGSSAAAPVKRSLDAGKLNCSGCHVEAHNVNLPDTVPLDIPLYVGYRWSSPMEASIFAGETFAPEGYGSGQVVISDRRLDVETTQVISFYTTQLGVNTWTLESTHQAAGWFTLKFAKGKRGVVINGYNTSNNDGTGQVSNKGLRIEIWYK